jgi:hypothetical protein
MILKITKKCYFFHLEAFYGYYDVLQNQVPFITNQPRVGAYPDPETVPGPG